MVPLAGERMNDNIPLTPPLDTTRPRCMASGLIWHTHHNTCDDNYDYIANTT